MIWNLPWFLGDLHLKILELPAFLVALLDPKHANTVIVKYIRVALVNSALVLCDRDKKDMSAKSMKTSPHPLSLFSNPKRNFHL